MARPRDETTDAARDERDAMAATTVPWSAGALALLVAITLVAAGLRLFHLEQWSLGNIEAATWRAVTLPIGGANGFCASNEGHYPLAFLGLRQALASGLLPGSGEGWLRLPFAFFGTLTVPLFALVTARHVGRAVALVAALLLALHPWHVFVSQSADPRGVAILLAMASLAVVPHAAPDARRRGWVITSLGLVAAGATHPLGWCFALGVLALVSLRRWSSALRGERVLRGVGMVLLLVVLLRAAADEGAAVASRASWLSMPFAGVHALGLPVLVLAVAGLCLVRPMSRALLLGALLPVALALFAALVGGPVAADVAAAALLPLLLAAAMFLRWAFGRTGAAIAAGSPVHWLAWLPGAIVVSALTVDSFLYTTAQSGWREPWRKAANAVLANVHAPSAGVVAAGVGAESLCYYLLPNHWRAGVRDAHENVRIVPLPADRLAAAIAELPPDVDLLVLREDEAALAAALPAAKQRLAAEFEVLLVLPCPQAYGDETVTVYRRAAGR